MKYFCNSCGYVEDTESHDREEQPGGLCVCGADDWLEAGDPVIDENGVAYTVESIGKDKHGSYVTTDKGEYGFGELKYYPQH